MKELDEKYNIKFKKLNKIFIFEDKSLIYIYFFL